MITKWQYKVSTRNLWWNRQVRENQAPSQVSNVIGNPLSRWGIVFAWVTFNPIYWQIQHWEETCWISRQWHPGGCVGSLQVVRLRGGQERLGGPGGSHRWRSANHLVESLSTAGPLPVQQDHSASVLSLKTCRLLSPSPGNTSRKIQLAQ